MVAAIFNFQFWAGSVGMPSCFPRFLKSAYPKPPLCKLSCFFPEVHTSVKICHISAPLLALSALYISCPSTCSSFLFLVLFSFSQIYPSSALSSVCVLLIMCSRAYCAVLAVPFQLSPGDVFEACATLVVHRLCPFLVLSLDIAPHIHHSIIISSTSICFSCCFVVVHTALYTFPFSFTGISFCHTVLCCVSLHFYNY